MGMVEELGAPVVNENEEMDEAANANFANDRERVPNVSNPNYLINCSTGPLSGPAMEEKIGRRLFLDTVKAEQRERFLRSLVAVEVGTNRVEANQIRSRKS